VGRSRSATSNLLRLLQLPAIVQEAIRSGAVDAGHARVLVGLPAAHQRTMLEMIRSEGLSVRDVEARARLLGIVDGASPASQTSAPTAGTQKRAPLSPDWQKMQTDIADILGLPVALSPKAKGGELRIRFSSTEEFDGLLERFFPDLSRSQD
jgi:ParB family chromosome partitioning protein